MITKFSDKESLSPNLVFIQLRGKYQQTNSIDKFIDFKEGKENFEPYIILMLLRLINLIRRVRQILGIFVRLADYVV